MSFLFQKPKMLFLYSKSDNLTSPTLLTKMNLLKKFLIKL